MCSLPLIFTLHWWLLAFSHFVTAVTKFSCCSSNKKMSPSVFLSLALNPCCPFSCWTSLAWRPLSLFLCFSCCIFQICGHDNLSMLNTLNNMDTERIPPSSLLTLLFSLLYKTPVAMRFPTRITLSCIWVAIPVSRVWYPGWGTLRALEYLKRCKIIFWVLLECAHENCKHKVRHIKETVVNDMKVEMILAVE